LKNSEFTKLEIYSTSGMRVHSQLVSGMRNVRIDLANYRSGMYFISLIGEGIQTEKFIVE
jgi:hypothetical protein